MTLWEMLLTLGGTALVLGLLMAVTNSVRADSAGQQTRMTLHSLNVALSQYHQVTGMYPPEPINLAMACLKSVPQSAAALRQIPRAADDMGREIILDGYGRALRYQYGNTSSASHHFNQPDFISAGPDGSFGSMNDNNPALKQAMTDNLYASDLQLPTP